MTELDREEIESQGYCFEDFIEDDDIPDEELEADVPMEFFELSDELLESVLEENKIGQRYYRQVETYKINRNSEFIKWLEENVGIEHFVVQWFEDTPIFFFERPEDAFLCKMTWAGG